MQRVPKLGKLACHRPGNLRLMAPPSSLLREDTSSRILSAMQRQLAPTVGPEASGGRNRAGSAFAGIGDTVAIGRVLYAGGFPLVLQDEYWIPARERVVRNSIVPIGGIHIYIGETASSGAVQVSSAEETAAGLEAIA